MENNTEQTQKVKLPFWKSGKVKVFLVVLIVGLSLFGFNVRKDLEKKEEASGGVPTPTLPYIERQQNKLTLIDKLPYVTDKFTIEYFPSDDTFFVQIKQNPYAANQKLVIDWFKENGVDTENVQIEWTSVRGVL